MLHLRRGGKRWTSTEPRLSTKGGKRNRGSWRGSSSRRQMASDASSAGTARGDAGNWLLFVLNGGRLVTSAPCCSASVPAHPLLCLLWTLQRGHSGSLMGIKLVLEVWGSGYTALSPRANSLQSSCQTKSADIRHQPIWGFCYLCLGHRFNPHNLTKSSGILTEHGLPEYLLCVLCTVFLFLLLFMRNLRNFVLETGSDCIREHCKGWRNSWSTKRELCSTWHCSRLLGLRGAGRNPSFKRRRRRRQGRGFSS